MRVIIAGGGRVGQHLASALVASGHSILVDRDPKACEQVRALGIEEVCGDDGAPGCLEHAQIQGCDVVAAVTGVDENNIVTAFLARSEYGARGSSPG